MHHPLHIIAYHCGIGAGNHGCKDGPEAIKVCQVLDECLLELHWHGDLVPEAHENKLSAISLLSEKLAAMTEELTQQQQPFVLLGGDHSSGIGTWSGCAKGLQGPLGLIWSDAHLDAHTFDTTPSQNIHGMPVAALLGHGDPSLVNIAQQSPSIQPENLCFIGVRDYEDGELKLLQDLGVRMITGQEVTSRGLSDCLDEALHIANEGTAGFGLSIDLDGFDPSFAPAVGTPVEHGLNPKEMCDYFSQKNLDTLIGVEIVEYNPHFDESLKTAKLIPNLLNAIFAQKNHSS